MTVRARTSGKNASSATTHTVSMPAGVVAGDRLLVGFVSDEAQITTSTSTSGWSSLGSQGQGTTTNHRLTIFTKVATGSDTLTVSVSATTEAGWTVVALVGDGGTPTIVLDNGGSATTATPSAITGLAIDFYDSLVFLGLDNNTAVAHTVTPPSGYANLTTAAATSDPVGAWSMDAAVTGTGATPAAVTWTNAEQWVTAHVMVRSVVYVAPDSVFDLANWKLTLPTDGADAGTNADEITQPALATYADANFTLDASNRMVMTAPVTGATTSGSGGARSELREMDGGVESAWDMALADRSLTVSGFYDPTSITGGTAPRKEMIIGQIHATGGTPPIYITADYDSTPTRMRVYKDGPGVGNLVTGFTTASQLAFRIEITDGSVNIYGAIGDQTALPATPQFSFPAAGFVEPTNCYLKAGAYNKTETASGSSGAAVATITYLSLVQNPSTQVITAAVGPDTSTVFTPASLTLTTPTIRPTAGPDTSTVFTPTGLVQTVRAAAGPDTSTVFAPKLTQTVRVAAGPDTSTVFTPTSVAAGIRPPLRVDFWAHADDGTLLAPLPQPTAWALTLIPGQPGAVTLDYPVDGINFDVLDQRITRDRDLRVAVRVDGTHQGALGARLNAREGDEVSEGGVVTFHGRFLTGDLGEVILVYNPADEKGETSWVDATAGRIIGDLLAAAQARGALTHLHWSFTAAVDSTGTAWATTTSPTFSPHTTLLAIAQQLRGWGMCEFEVTSGMEVRMYNPAAVGTNWTVADPPLVLRAGRDLVEAPRRTDVAAAATALYVAGRDGVYVSAADPDAVAVRGRRIEQGISQNNLTTSGAAQAYATLELARRTVGDDELTHALTFDQDQPVPLRELRGLDLIYSDRGQGLEAERVAQIVVAQRQGDPGYSGSVVLRDLLDSADEALARQVGGLSGGQIVTGTSAAPPDTDDGKAPAQVTGLGVTTGFYRDSQNAPWAAIAATWLAVTTNADGTTATDIVGYAVQMQYTGGPPMPSAWLAVGQVTGTGADWDRVVASQPVAVRVAAVDRYGRVGAWSATTSLTSASDTTVPPTPSTPDADSYLGIFTVRWDGRSSAGAGMPPWVSHVEVHLSQTSSFTPHRPLRADGSLDEAASTTYIDRLFAAGTMPSTAGDYGQTWFARLVAVSRSRVASTPSAQDSAVLVQAADGDVSALSVGKLTTGLMSAIMTVSGIIRTATTGSRVEIDAAGIRCYLGSTLVFGFSIPSQLVSIIGKITAVDPGSPTEWITLDPDFTQPGAGNFPTLAFQAGGGSARWPARINAVNDLVNSSTTLGLNSGGTTNTTTWRQTTLFLSPDLASLSRNAGGGGFDLTDVVGGRVDVGVDSINAQVINTSTSSGERDGGYFWLNRGPSTGSVFGVKTATRDSFFRILDDRIQVVANTNTRAEFFNNGQVQINGISNVQLSMGTDGKVVLGTSGNTFIRMNPSGNIEFFEGGTGYSSLSNLKSFVIDHPTDPDRLLVHVCTESPRAGVEYWGEVQIVDGAAEVVLPAYFDALTDPADRQVQLTPIDELCMVAAGRIAAGRFTVRCSGPDGTRVAWLVKAARRVGFDVEPLCADVTVGGDGPYRYVVPDPGSARAAA